MKRLGRVTPEHETSCVSLAGMVLGSRDEDSSLVEACCLRLLAFCPRTVLFYGAGCSSFALTRLVLRVCPRSERCLHQPGRASKTPEGSQAVTKATGLRRGSPLLGTRQGSTRRDRTYQFALSGWLWPVASCSSARRSGPRQQEFLEVEGICDALRAGRAIRCLRIASDRWPRFCNVKSFRERLCSLTVMNRTRQCRHRGVSRASFDCSDGVST